jgi:hypothetical protein
VVQAQATEVVVGHFKAQSHEILGRLEDPGDGHTRLRGIVDRGGRAAPGEPMQLEVTAGVEDVERF